jgi:hypothetical protein
LRWSRAVGLGRDPPQAERARWRASIKRGVFWNGEEVCEEGKRIGETFVKELFWRMIFYIAIAATADICTINEGAIAPDESQSI